MLTLSLVLALVAFLATIGSTFNKVPLWVPVLLLCILALLSVLPR